MKLRLWQPTEIQSITPSTSTEIPHRPSKRPAEDTESQTMVAGRESTVNSTPPLIMSTSTGTSPPFPLEIVDMIVNLVSRKDMFACALVNRNWANSARSKLWTRCGLSGDHRSSRFLDLPHRQSQSDAQGEGRGDLVPVSMSGIPKITAYLAKLSLKLDPSTVGLCCQVLKHMGPSLKELGLVARDCSKGNLCQIADACPESVNCKKLSIEWRKDVGDEQPRAGGVPDSFQKLQKFFRRFVEIRWCAGGDPYVVLASAQHQELRVFEIEYGKKVSDYPETDRITLIGSLPQTLVAFSACGGRTLCGETGTELLLLGKRCPNLKAFRFAKMGIVTNEHLGKPESS
ncbi:hypothetical protein HK102_005476 [Quaeritorhiza haematococci]|nr:hypothetical protein HK102_005476 [Quaeritorhiza haematococci]